MNIRLTTLCASLAVLFATSPAASEQSGGCAWDREVCSIVNCSFTSIVEVANIPGLTSTLVVTYAQTTSQLEIGGTVSHPWSDIDYVSLHFGGINPVDIGTWEKPLCDLDDHSCRLQTVVISEHLETFFAKTEIFILIPNPNSNTFVKISHDFGAFCHQ